MSPKNRSRKTAKQEKNKYNESSIISNSAKATSIALLHSKDVIENIFSYLDYDTLCVVPFVCRFWQKKAHERLLKNHPPFSVDLPISYCKGHEQNLNHNKETCVANNPTIKNLLTTVPEKVAIIFVPRARNISDATNNLISDENNLYNVVEGYLEFLPYASFAVHEWIYVDNVELSDKENLMTALFFPTTPSVEIRTTIIPESRMNNYFAFADGINELFDIDDPDDIEYCLIILGINHKDCKPRKNSYFLDTTLDHLKTMVDPCNKLTVWGGAHVEVRHRDIEPNSEGIQWHILSIMGINSYSIALSLDLDEETFKEKLKDVKDKITFKKESFALAITHTKDSEPKEKERIMKKVLWFKDIFNIKLTTILSYVEDYSCDPIIFCNPTDNINLKIENDHNTVGYLIVSN